jgi:cystathionine gamma-lyase
MTCNGNGLHCSDEVNTSKGFYDDVSGFGTTAIHAGQDPERWDMNQLVPPISMCTTYKQDKPGQPKVHDYCREGNPTRDVLEESLAALENAKYCRIYSSGMSATMSLANILTTGDHIICSDNIYGGTERYFRKISVPRHGMQLDFVDLNNLKEFKNALKPNTKIVWFESPSNPLLKVVDIQAVVDITKQYNKDILVIVDNTFMSPYFQRPLALGADAVVHSLTKYVNGHTDVLMGAVMTNSNELEDHLHFMQLALGAIPSPFEAFLVNRGIKTLHLRMEQHWRNGLAVAKFLEANPRVEKVLYPELESHPQHHIHKKQARGMSGMISFYIKGGLEEAETFLSNLKIFKLAISLGSVESIAQLPKVMSHAMVPEDVRQRLGISDSLIRLHVGCEQQVLFKFIKIMISLITSNE